LNCNITRGLEQRGTNPNETQQYKMITERKDYEDEKN